MQENERIKVKENISKLIMTKVSEEKQIAGGPGA